MTMGFIHKTPAASLEKLAGGKSIMTCENSEAHSHSQHMLTTSSSLRVAWLRKVKRYMQSLSSLGLDKTGNYYHLPLLPEDAESKYDMVTAFADDIKDKLEQEKSISAMMALRLSVAQSSHHRFDDSLTRALTKLLLEVNTNHESAENLTTLTISSEILSSLSDRNMDKRDLAMALDIQEAIVLKMLEQDIPPEHHAIVRSAVSRYCQIHDLCQDRLSEVCESAWHEMAVISPLHILLNLSRRTSLLNVITEPEMAWTDFYGRSLFHLALDLRLNGLVKVKTLFKSSQLEDMTKRKPLHIASLHGQTATSLALVDLAARAESLEDQDRRGRTALHIASAKGHAALALQLLKRGAANDSLDIRGRTPLYYAIVGGQVSTTSIHAKLIPWQDWSTLVLPAVEGGNVAVLSMITGRLTPPLSAEVKIKALEEAVLKGSESLIEFVIQVIAPDIYLGGHFYGPDHDETLVEIAVRTKNAHVLDLLISNYNAPVDFPQLLASAHSTLIASGSEDVMSVLLESRHVDPNSRTLMGRKTALHFAVRYNCYEMVRILLDHGADIEIRDFWGRTPIFDAVTLKRLQIIEMLLEAGARTDVKDRSGKSLLEVCIEDEAPNMEIKGLLEKYMSKGVDDSMAEVDDGESSSSG